MRCCSCHIQINKSMHANFKKHACFWEIGCIDKDSILIDQKKKYGVVYSFKCTLFTLILSKSSGTKIFPEKCCRASAVYFSLRVASVLSSV